MKQCILCLNNSSHTICDPCQADLPWVTQTCPACGRYNAFEKICAVCQQQPSLWDVGIAPLSYQAPITQFITQLKFSRQFYQARILADLFIAQLPVGALPQLLLPVPLHPWRMLWRGFNQSTELCKILSSVLNIPYSPYYLKRHSHGQQQKGSNKMSRQINVKNAFQLIRPLNVSHVAIVDDVFTTGETFGDICRAIRKVHPHIRIDAWAMAQTLLGS